MIGATLSQYRIVDRIGEGGMGVVYEAEDEILRRTVAIKVLHPEHVGHEARRRRFLREAQSAAALGHPNIASIYQAGNWEGTLFIAMERVRGRDLRSLLVEGVDLPELVRIATQIAEGMGHAHERTIVHRDLKPENVMLTDWGQVKILDFGIAKITEAPALDPARAASEAETAGLTLEGTILGTPDYISPEQARGQPVDTRSDIFSFGSMLYEMLTGRQPFHGATPLDTLGNILYAEPPPPSQLEARIPPELDRIVQRCLQKDAAERYSQTSDLVAELQRVPRELVRERARRRRAPAIRAAAILVVGLVLLLTVADRRTRDAERSDGGRPPGGGPAAGERPSWILVADFQTAGDDPALAVAARELVTAALGQSRIVTPIPRAQLQQGLALAHLPEDTLVAGEVARQLAYRATARSYVEGRIDPFPSGYSVILDVMDAENAGRVMTLRQVAASDDDLIGAVDALALDLRQRLGERKQALRAARPLLEVITPSFEAYRDYVHAAELMGQREYGSSIALLRRALEHDGDFASAYLLLGLNQYNLQQLDSAQAAFDQALARPKRLLESERLRLQVSRATHAYDLVEALRFNELLLAEGAASFAAADWNNQGTLLFLLGRYAEALDAQVRACEASPFGPKQLQLYNRFRTLVQLGRLSEARQLAQDLSEVQRRLADLELAVSESNWAEARRLAHLWAEDRQPLLRFSAGTVLASMEAMRGAAGTAARMLDSLQARAPSPFYADLASIARAHMLFMTETPAAAAPAPAASAAPTSASGWIVRGIGAAIAGDTATARACRAALERQPDVERRRYEVDGRLLEAWIAARTGRWRQVIDLLEPTTSAGPGPWVTGRLPARWLVAEANERLGHLEEAAAAFERVLSSERLHHDVWVWRAIAWSVAHRRLVLLYARFGRQEEARRHWQIFRDDFTAPDPEFGAWIDEARAVMAAAASSP